MDVEKARVTGRAERLNAQAASFLTGRTNNVPERLFHGALVSRARMKTSEDEQLQASSSERRFSASRDRKSTRLNSSHGYISYAVFCLKKKKKKDTIE